MIFLLCMSWERYLHVGRTFPFLIKFLLNYRNWIAEYRSPHIDDADDAFIPVLHVAEAERLLVRYSPACRSRKRIGDILRPVAAGSVLEIFSGLSQQEAYWRYSPACRSRKRIGGISLVRRAHALVLEKFIYFCTARLPHSMIAWSNIPTPA